jgi:signal transduction histidine kinase
MNDPTITKCIVVADDESGTRALLGKLLRRHGYEVLEASDGEQALALAVSRPVDLFLCDLQMPRMRGEDVGRWIDQLDPPVPVILMTAYPSFESALAAVKCHAADYLEKPFRSLEYVVEAVEKALLRKDHAAARHAAPGGTAAKSVAEDAEAARNRFLAGVADDLRRPMAEVRMLTAGLLAGTHGPLTTEQRETLAHVDAEAETAEAEADKLEWLARMASADFKPRLEPVPAAEILTGVLRTLLSRAGARSVDLRAEVPDASVAVLADVRDLPRAVRAIGENALRYCGEGGRVLLRATSEPSGVRFEVLDDGIGIDPADHARIFQPYVRVENALTRRHRGCGLGLAYAARIVEAHGARIEVRSGLGEGSKFSFLLPYATLFVTESCSMDLGAR